MVPQAISVKYLHPVILRARPTLVAKVIAEHLPYRLALQTTSSRESSDTMKGGLQIHVLAITGVPVILLRLV